MNNIEELNTTFNNYINEVKKLDTTSKRNELINSVKEIITLFQNLVSKDNIEIHYLKSKEILELSKQTMSEDDFIELTLIYVEVAKNIIGEYLEGKGL